jgi:serine-type D-Ala-D-Ala carboxypeptidase (penicillin-binding protein 5/6)
MRLAGRPAAALTALAAAGCLAAASPVAASAAVGSSAHGASAASSPAPTRKATASSPAPTRKAAASSTASAGKAAESSPSPSPTSQPIDKATVGGPLMASKRVVVNYPSADSPRVPNIPASAWVIANANTGQVLAAKDPHGLYGPASTMKVLTAITLIPRLDPNAWVTASPWAASAEPNDVGLVPGRKYQVKDLFTALLTISANDAAVALTQASGSFAKGMALINAEAHHLQAYDVVAKQPNGLPDPGQVESAYDEALIARQALSVPAFMKYDETLSARFEVKPKDWETLDNQNYLLTQYPGGIGGKIGWTISSEATYIGLARRHGVTLIATVLHCTSLQEITSAEKLLNWGFAMNGKTKPVGVLVPPLATTAAVHKARRTHPVASAPASSAGQTTAYAVGAGVVAVGLGLGVGGYVGTRRRRKLRHQRESGA